MLERIYTIKLYYSESESEEVLGVIDYDNRIVRLIEVSKEFQKGFREKGFINFDFIKRLEIIKGVGCIGEKDGKEECFIE